MLRPMLTISAAIFITTPIAAQNMATQTVGESLEDIEFALESAILDMGLAIDFVSHTGAMLERTREDVGSDVVLFTGATIYNFCSATVSRQVMEADLNNIIYCPYSIFAYSTPENPEETVIGHQLYPGHSMQPANDLLGQIIANALE